jgi:hypothetical protein
MSRIRHHGTGLARLHTENAVEQFESGRILTPSPAKGGDARLHPGPGKVIGQPQIA